LSIALELGTTTALCNNRHRHRARRDPSIRTDGPFCSTDDPDVAKAFALYAGSSVEELDGTEFIVDQSGSLRSSWHPGLVPDWTDPKVFAEVVDNIRRTLPRRARLLGTLTCIDGPCRHPARRRTRFIGTSALVAG
jgi:hypothetical protein